MRPLAIIRQAAGLPMVLLWSLAGPASVLAQSAPPHSAPLEPEKAREVAEPIRLQPPKPAKAAVPAASAPVVVQDLRGFGRLTMPPRRAAYTFTLAGENLVIGLPPDIAMPATTRRPRNALSMSWNRNVLEVVAVPGASFRVVRKGRGLVVDILDPPPEPAASPLAAPVAPVQSEPIASAPAAPSTLPANAPAVPVMQPLPEPKAVQLVEMASVPLPPAARTVATAAVPAGRSESSFLPPPGSGATARAPIRIEAVAGTSDPSILLPAERGVGLAAFRAGSETLFILDAPIDYQMSPPLLDPVFAGISSGRTEDATVVRVPGPPSHFRVSRGTRGWIVAAGEPLVPIDDIKFRLAETAPGAFSMRFAMSEPSRVVAVADPDTGGTLLVGTQAVPGQASLGESQQPQFVLLPTFQGLVVSPNSDDIRMRREPDGFGLSAGPVGGGTILSGARTRVRGPLYSPSSRLFALPVDSVRGLYSLMNERVSAAANAPFLTRSEPRLRVAEAMIALGLGVEAMAVLDVAAAADPSLAEHPQALGLGGAAALMAQRLDRAGSLLHPKLNGTQEVELWRALLQVERGEVAAGDAGSMAAALPILQAYPQPLRDRFLPATLEAMSLHGQAAAAVLALGRLPEDTRLALARGMALEMTGHAPEALKAYDQVAGRPDRLPRYKAMVRAIELRLKGGELDAKAAADAMDRSIYGWRGARQELALRMRVADLRRQAGQWSQALAVLRDGKAAFPDDQAQIDREMATTLTALLAGDSAERMPPAEFVALYDQNQDLVQGMAWDERTGTKFVERLIALGLQGRAEPVMAGLVSKATDPGRRVFLGTRLASLRMMSNDPAGAIAALADTAPLPGVPVDALLAGARQLLYARAEAGRGNKDLALSMLASLPSAAADEARADIHASREDWPHVVEALTSLERRRILTTELDADKQALVMRLAVAATLSSDAVVLQRLTSTYGSAMAKSGSAALFQLMTSAPVRATGDLPRAFREIQAARQVQGRMASPKLP